MGTMTEKKTINEAIKNGLNTSQIIGIFAVGLLVIFAGGFFFSKKKNKQPKNLQKVRKPNFKRVKFSLLAFSESKEAAFELGKRLFGPKENSNDQEESLVGTQIENLMIRCLNGL